MKNPNNSPQKQSYFLVKLWQSILAFTIFFSYTTSNRRQIQELPYLNNQLAISSNKDKTYINEIQVVKTEIFPVSVAPVINILVNTTDSCKKMRTCSCSKAARFLFFRMLHSLGIYCKRLVQFKSWQINLTFPLTQKRCQTLEDSLVL